MIITIAAKSKQISILQMAGEASAYLNLDPTYRLACSSFCGLPYRILNIQLAKPQKRNYSGDSDGLSEHFINSKARQLKKPEFETHNKLNPEPSTLNPTP